METRYGTTLKAEGISKPVGMNRHVGLFASDAIRPFTVSGKLHFFLRSRTCEHCQGRGLVWRVSEWGKCPNCLLYTRLS